MEHSLSCGEFSGKVGSRRLSSGDLYDGDTILFRKELVETYPILIIFNIFYKRAFDDPNLQHLSSNARGSTIIIVNLVELV